MIRPIRNVLATRSPRDRIAIAALAAVLGSVLCAWFVLSAQRAREALAPEVARLRVEAVRLEKGAEEIARLRAALPASSPAAETQGDFRARLAAQAGSAGLAGAVASIESPEAGRAKVTYGAVSFSAWLAWVGSLQAQRIRLDAARIEASPVPGIVGATATFVQPAQ